MRRALPLALACCAFAAHAEDARWYLQVDNDVLFATDRWYSSGVRLARVAPRADGAMEWGAVHEVFTPEAKFFAAGDVDRAPAARLVAYGARHWDTASVFATVEGQLGIRGKGAQGEAVTRAIHRVIAAPKVDWSREVSTRADARLAGTATHRLGPFAAHYGLVLGNELAFAHVGAQLSAGPAPLMSQALRHVATPPFANAQGWGAFAGASVRALARDRTLDLGYDPTVPPPDERRTVTRIAAGASYTSTWGAVSLTAVQDSRAFDQQREPQRYGVLAVHVAF